MATVLLVQGPPGCGKNTWATEYVKNMKGAGGVVINRDDMRTMFVGGNLHNYKFNKSIEALVTTGQQEIAQTAVRAGKSVVVADTNLNPKTVKAWQDFARANKCDFVIYNMFDTYRAENEKLEQDRGIKGVIEAYRKLCKERNLRRMNSVPEDVIDRFIDDYILSAYWKPRQHVQCVGVSDAIVVDIDGTMAHMGNKRGPFEWKKVGVDDPDRVVINTVQLYKNACYEVIVMSGRDEVCRPETEEWLRANSVPYDHLFMRPQGDQRPDNLIKEELFFQNVEGNFNVEVVLDDRDQVVSQWRAMGLKVYQVAPGNF